MIDIGRDDIAIPPAVDGIRQRLANAGKIGVEKSQTQEVDRRCRLIVRPCDHPIPPSRSIMRTDRF